ncbi:MFS transporter [Actinoplanes sp. NPDC049596]|uniref:MFS transporter n=1 Tax=unclassified Actinoplanes TaxID=2626549 RepID=UPI00342F4044
MTVADRPATYREVFAEPSFRALFVARTLAIGATSLQIFALSVLVYAGTGSPLLSALAFAAGFLPQFVGGLLLGSLTDRLPPRRLITIGYAVEAALALLLGLAHLPVAVALSLVALVACGTPVFAGAAARVIAERLTGDAYVLGRSVSNMSSSAAQLLGLAAGGVAVAAVGARSALLIAAVCFTVAALAARLGLPTDSAAEPAGLGLPIASAAEPARLGLPIASAAEPARLGLPTDSAAEPAGLGLPTDSAAENPAAGPGRLGLSTDSAAQSPAAEPRRGTVQDSWAGTKALLADRTIRRLLLVQWLPSALIAGAEALLVSYGGRRGFPAGAGAILMGAPAVGMLLGNFAVGRFLRPTLRERFAGALVVVLGAPLIALLIAPPFPVVVALLVLAGTGYAYGLGVQRAFLDAAPAGRRGQLFALHSTGLMALQGAGPLLLGVLAEATSPTVAIAAAGAATALMAPALRRGC